MNRLTLTYKADDEWHGELSAQLRCGEFAGCGSAWFNASQVMDFAKAMEAYPLDVDNPPVLEGGIWNSSIVQLNLRVRILPVGHQGRLSVSVELAETNPRDDLSSEIRASYLVTYGDLESFRSDLVDHMQGSLAEATLLGSAS